MRPSDINVVQGHSVGNAHLNLKTYRPALPRSIYEPLTSVFNNNGYLYPTQFPEVIRFFHQAVLTLLELLFLCLVSTGHLEIPILIA